ncbi:helix-turn-helix domain-containing protein [Metabacillus litoralis]|uniref:helix-turn-helix domain-containing protein n=1 Tax=Metabacillus litoralis TaxID=152268 RepID=UPI001CFE0082|nr:helix-turn-helix domain-containing protein [Metabacillus litoralis]
MAINLNNYVINTPSPPPGILVSDTYKNDDKYHIYRSKGTKDWLMIYTASGEGAVRVGGKQFFHTAGTLTILPPGVTHDYYTIEGHIWEMQWCHFIPRPSWIEWLPKISKNTMIFHTEIKLKSERIAIYESFRKVIQYNLHSENLFHYELAINALEETILLLANYLHQQNSSTVLLDSRIKEAVDYVTENYNQQIQVKELAKHVSLSPSRLSHLYKEQVGESIIETVKKIRLKQAERLLLHTTRTINEISHEVGYQTPDYFTRIFTDYFGESPSAYRKKRRVG